MAASRTIAKSLAMAKIGDKIKLSGWIQSLRIQKRIAFIGLSDGSTFKSLQTVHHQPDQIKDQLDLGTCLTVDGTIRSSPGQGQDSEVVINELQVLGRCDPERYPLQKKGNHTLDYLRDHAHLRSRTSQGRRILQIRNALVDGLHRWYQDNDFLQVNTPLITSSDCEGGGQVLKVDAKSASTETSKSFPPALRSGFFGNDTFLTVSGQLHLETLISAYPKVYTISPCFRAEPSQTSRHLAEFWMLEAEIAFTRSLDHLMDLTEGSVKASIQRVLERCGDWSLPPDILACLDSRWKRMTYTDAIEALNSEGAPHFTTAVPQWGMALQSEHERWLSSEFAKGPVFITHYPDHIKPFYMEKTVDTPSDRPTVDCFDLLVPTGELAGGSIRVSDHEKLAQNLREHGLPEESYAWYLELREFGSTPHGGFGLGIDRMVQWLSGSSNVKEVIPFPRWAGHCKF